MWLFKFVKQSNYNQDMLNMLQYKMHTNANTVTVNCTFIKDTPQIFYC